MSPSTVVGGRMRPTRTVPVVTCRPYALAALLAACWSGAPALDAEKVAGMPLQVNGSFESVFQWYHEDRASGIAEVPPEKIGSNSSFTATARMNAFGLGLRLEAYEPAISGFDPRYKDVSLAHRYFEYAGDFLSVTLGNFYEQFGNGLVLRAYRDWDLGYDNAFDGVRIGLSAPFGLRLKALVAKQRLYLERGPGVVRGADGEFFVNDLWSGLAPSVGVGGSFVSRYQQASHPTLNLPQNVAAWAARGTFAWGGFSLLGEFAWKINDPSAANGMLFNDGDAQYAALSYSRPGVGVTLSVLRADNMDFRSDRAAIANDLLINCVPDLTVAQIRSLASMYPFATQPLGEWCFQADGVFAVPRKTLIGGPKGMGIKVNYTQVNDIGRAAHANPHIGYESSLFMFNDTLFYRNFNAGIDRWFGTSLGVDLQYGYYQRNDAVLNVSDYHSMIYAHVAGLGATYKLNAGHSLKAGVEHLATAQDKGAWLAGSAEWQHRWLSLFISDDYNYGNGEKAKRLHYYSVGGTVTRHTTRFSLSYGRRRAGIICTGGVCRAVPALNGLAANLTVSF